MRHNKKQIHLLCLLFNCIYARSASQLLSLNDESALRLLNLNNWFV